jgi:hypothetical protein
MPAGKAAALLAGMLCLAGEGLSAHRLDEYLQAARISVEPDRVDVELSLTPGVAVAGTIVGDIDRDRDGVISTREADAYASAVMGQLEMSLDGQALSATIVTTSVPDASLLQSGDGVIRITARAALPRLPSGSHQLAFRNHHRRDVSVYLANALVPESDRVAVTAQDRDGEQHALTIRYVLDDERRASMSFGGLMAAGALVIMFALGYQSRRLVIP